MLKFALAGLFLYGSALLAQIEVFSAESKDALYLFVKNYRLNQKLADKILEQNFNFPIDILVTANNNQYLNGYILTEQNQNMELNASHINGSQKITMRYTTEKYHKKYFISHIKANQISTMSNQRNKLELMVEAFQKNSKEAVTNIYTLSSCKLFKNVKLPIKIEAAKLEASGVAMFAFVYNGDIYDQNGMSITQNEAVMPVEFERVSESFSAYRLHPILKYLRPHEGVDLVAKAGMPVCAVMDGYISDIGYDPNIGNYAKIMHQNRIETIYGHLEKLKSDLRFGVKVHKKEVIGLVGSTGLATGPHLHFGVKKDGKYINPALIFANTKSAIADRGFFIVAKSAKERMSGLQ